MRLALRTTLLTTALAALALAQAPADPGATTPIVMPRRCALSPDGAHVAFSWRGELWLAPSEGGAARRLTTEEGPDDHPSFSPDGAHLAFNSRRSGSEQVWVMPAGGGRPRQVTRHTAGQRLVAWTADGDHLLVRASRDHWHRDAARFYLQPLSGEKAPELLFDAAGSDGALTADGTRLLFVREGVGRWRKGYRGSQAAQLWLWEKDAGFRALEIAPWGTRSPRWLDEKAGSFLCVTERDGTWNLARGRLDSDALEQLTHFQDDGIDELAVSRDGSTAFLSRAFESWRMDLATGAMKQVTFHHVLAPLVAHQERRKVDRARGVSVSQDGLEIAFVADGDLYVMDTVLREPVAVLRTPEEERDPLFLPDGSGLVFSSDSGGQADLWLARRVDETLPWWRNTQFKLERLTEDEAMERSPRLVPGKETCISYLRGLGDLVLHDHAKKEVRTIVSSWNAPDYQWSPDGEWVVYSIQDDDFNHDVHILPTDHSREPFNLSMHPDNDRSPRWSADGKYIAFVGRRSGDEVDVYWVPLRKEIAEKTSREKKLEEALKKMKGRKGKAKPAGKKPPAKKKKAEPEGHPLAGAWSGSADGDGLPAALTFDLEIRVAEDGSISGSFKSNMGAGELTGRTTEAGAFVLEVEVRGTRIEIEGKREGDRVRGTWTSVMGQGTFSAERVKKAEEKKPEPAPKKEEKPKKKLEIDFEGLRDRMRRISNANSREGDLFFSSKGAVLHFRATVNGKAGYHKVDLAKPGRPAFVTSDFGSDRHWIDGGKRIGALVGGTPAILSSSGKAQRFSFDLYVTREVGAHNRVIFDQAWRLMRDNWYDERLGNKDWDAIRERYAPMAEKARTSAELSEVCNRMLGELNGSHLGFSAFGGRRGRSSSSSGDAWRPSTVHLGVRFDPDHRGPGLRVRDVLKGTPAARESTRLDPGDLILAINGETVSPEDDLARHLTLPPSSLVTLTVRAEEAEESATREVTLEPTSYGSVRRALYEHWLEGNREMVEKLSGGQLGYLHIQSMGGRNLQVFEEELFKIGHGKKGLLIDVRDNGGGSITDHLLTCLCQPTHAITRPRGGGEGYPHDRRIYATWDRPIVVLCNQNSFSNAEIFSHAIKTLGRGQVVGVTTAGGVISTGGRSIMGEAFVRMPFRGWYLLDGRDMELNGCVPHHELWPAPGELPAGRDRQLTKAVKVLLQDVAEAEAKPRPRLLKATEQR